MSVEDVIHWLIDHTSGVSAEDRAGQHELAAGGPWPPPEPAPAATETQTQE